MNKGKFIIFEGIDCSGKTTLVEAIKKHFKNLFFFTKEPYGTDLKDEIKIIMQKSIAKNDDMSTMLAFALERSYHIKNYILPHLDNGKSVISDRFFLSTLVYQGITIPKSVLQQVYDIIKQGIVIDKIFFCKISPDKALARMSARKDNNFLDEYYYQRMKDIAISYQELLLDYQNVIFLDMEKPLVENVNIVVDIINNENLII